MTIVDLSSIYSEEDMLDESGDNNYSSELRRRQREYTEKRRKTEDLLELSRIRKELGDDDLLYC